MNSTVFKNTQILTTESLCKNFNTKMTATDCYEAKKSTQLNDPGKTYEKR
jgi:hypothetical protein